MIKVVDGNYGTEPLTPTPYEQLSSRINSVNARVSSVENDMTQIDNILGEEVIPNVKSNDIETNEGDVEPSED